MTFNNIHQRRLLKKLLAIIMFVLVLIQRLMIEGQGIILIIQIRQFGQNRFPIRLWRLCPILHYKFPVIYSSLKLALKARSSAFYSLLRRLQQGMGRYLFFFFIAIIFISASLFYKKKKKKKDRSLIKNIGIKNTRKKVKKKMKEKVNELTAGETEKKRKEVEQKKKLHYICIFNRNLFVVVVVEKAEDKTFSIFLHQV